MEGWASGARTPTPLLDRLLSSLVALCLGPSLERLRVVSEKVRLLQGDLCLLLDVARIQVTRVLTATSRQRDSARSS